MVEVFNYQIIEDNGACVITEQESKDNSSLQVIVYITKQKLK